MNNLSKQIKDKQKKNKVVIKIIKKMNKFNIKEQVIVEILVNKLTLKRLIFKIRISNKIDQI